MQLYPPFCKEFGAFFKTAHVSEKSAAVFSKTARVLEKTTAVLNVYLCNFAFQSGATSGAASGVTYFFVMAPDYQRVKCQV